MASAAPLARSPIAPAMPVVVHQGWEVSTTGSSAPLRLCDLTPLAKVLVRAAPAGAVAAVLDCPAGRTTRNERGDLVVGLGPDEWIVIGPVDAAEEIVGTLAPASAREFATSIDSTHLSILLRLTGADAPRLLEKVCAIDLSEAATPDGAAFRSSVARVLTTVIRDDVGGERSYLLLGDRSSGQYLFDALLDAGEEFAVGVAGYVETES